MPDWLDGDREQPLPPDAARRRINRDWPHLFSRDVLSVPDKWEYPAFFAWDLAFHMIPMARIDPDFAKKQLLLFLREWYMHPNGQLPAFEYDLSNVNPPVHAWACWQVYKIGRAAAEHAFLERAFHKLLMNFTWWVNRKDLDGRNVFAGGFLGLDNLGVFDRSRADAGGHAWSRPTAPPGWGSTARPCWGSPWSWPCTTGRTRMWPASSSSTSCSSPTRSTTWAAGPVGRGGRVLLRPTQGRRQLDAAAGSLDGWLDPLAGRGGAGRGVTHPHLPQFEKRLPGSWRTARTCSDKSPT